MTNSAKVAFAVEKLKSMRRAERRIEKIRRDLENLLPTLSDEELSTYIRITEAMANDE